MRMINADLIQYEPMLSAKGNGMYEDVMVAYKSQIDDLPTIEERKTGKWIHERVNSEHSITGYFILGRCQCSECGVICEQEANYCPNCGADMRRRRT